MRPCLLTDIGDTLIRRARLGAKARAMRWLEAYLGRPLTAAEILSLRGAILTSSDPAEAARRVQRQHALPERDRAILHAVISESDGEAEILSGAVTLLERAATLGWRILAVTNACGWVSPLPRMIADRIETVISSATLGIIKDEAAFWHQAAGIHQVDRRFAIAIGNSETADIRPAALAGFAALRIDSETRLEDLAAALARAGPRPETAVGLVAGKVIRWGGQTILEAPNLAGLLQRVTRKRIRLVQSDASVAATLIRRTDRPPALVLPPSWAGPLVSWVEQSENRRDRHVPSALAEAIGSRMESFLALRPEMRRQLIHMVQEASDPKVRAARICDIRSLLR